MHLCENTKKCPAILDDQTQVGLKPAGQPEQASLNQCQLRAGPADGGDQVPVSLYCNRYKSPDWSLFPCDLALMPEQ